MSDGPIFIVGYYHSGTTLLQVILRNNPVAHVFKGESGFFANLSRFRQKYPDLKNDRTLGLFVVYLIKVANLGYMRTETLDKDMSISEIGVSQDQYDSIYDATKKALVGKDENNHVIVFQTVSDQLATINGRTRWVEKTPYHVLYLDTIFEAFEDARAIELVRDPRAALSSRKVRMTADWHRYREEHGGRVDKRLNFDPILDALRWQQMIKKGSEAQRNYPKQVMRVRYEDLVCQPETIVQAICSFLNLDYLPSMLDVSWVNSTTQASGETSTGISGAAVEKWRENLSKEELQSIQVLLRQEMKELGYSPEATGDIHTWMKMPGIIAHSASHLGGRLWRRFNVRKGYA